LQSNGRMASPVWVPAGVSVKMVLQDSSGNTISGGTIDNLEGINDLSYLYPQTTAEIAAGITPLYYQYPASPVADVRRYGAIGDGSTTNTTALQNAIATNQPLYFPPGIYLTGTLSVSSSVYWQGDGAATLQLNSTGSNIVIQTGGSQIAVDIQGLAFNANNLNTTGNAVLTFTSASNVLFQNNQIYNSATNGIWCFNNTTDVQILSNYIYNCVYSGILVEGNNAQLPTQQSVKCVISKNVVNNCTQQNGILVQRSLQDVVITDNVITNIGDCGIEVGGTPGSFTGSYGTKNVSIANNIILSSLVYSTQGAGMLIRDSSYVNISGNTVGTFPRGIQLLSSTGVSGTGNTLVQCGTTSSGSGAIMFGQDTGWTSGTGSAIINLGCTIEGASGQTAIIIDNTNQIFELNIVDNSPSSQIINCGSASGVINWFGRYYPSITNLNNLTTINIQSLTDGGIYSNQQNLNAISNALFLQNITTGWTGTSATLSASAGSLSITTTAPYGYGTFEIFNWARALSPVMSFTFQYNTTSTDASFFYLVDATQLTSLSLPSTGGSWVTKTIQINALSYLSTTNAFVRFLASAGSTGVTLQIRNPILGNGVCGTMGIRDYLNMTN